MSHDCCKHGDDHPGHDHHHGHDDHHHGRRDDHQQRCGCCCGCSCACHRGACDHGPARHDCHDGGGGHDHDGGHDGHGGHGGGGGHGGDDGTTVGWHNPKRPGHHCGTST